MSCVIYFLLLNVVIQSIAFDLPHSNCKSDLKINNNHYNVSETYEVENAYPTDAHFDEHGNLFFVETGRSTKGFQFNVKMIEARTTMVRKIHGLPNDISYSIAIDKKDEKVYFGTGRGIYSYDYDNDEAILVSETSLKLNMLFVDKDGNKYITESNNGIDELFLLSGHKKIRYHTLDALNELAIDDNNNFYFIKEEKIFVLKSSLSAPVLVGNVSYDGVAQITFHEEQVFVASKDLLVFHENETGNLNTIENTPGKVTAIAFEASGDFVLGIEGKLIKYKKNECYFRNPEY